MGAAEKIVPCAADEPRAMDALPEQINAWLRGARAGDRYVYATRAWLSPGALGAARMRVLERQGLVRLARKRSDLLLGEFVYFAERSSLALDRARRLKPVLEEGGRQVADAVLFALARTAKFGRPCPTDAKLAELAGVAVSKVPTALDALRVAGEIQIHSAPSPTNRVVTIVSTAQRTGGAR